LGFTGLLYLYGRNQNMIRKFGWFLFFVVAASSCLNEPDCYSLNNYVVGIAFKKMTNGQADTVFFTQIKADGSDSIFYSNAAVTGIDLPLNYYDNQTLYHIGGLGVTHDLLFDYTSQTQFVSEDCGERFVLSNLNVTSAAFDSVRFLSRTPKRQRQTGAHLNVYRCPNSRQIELRFSTPVIINNAGNDFGGSILLTRSAVTTFSLPLNPEADQTTTNFSFDNGDAADIVKTLTVSYNRKNDSTAYKVCGPQVVLSNFQVTNNFTSATVIRNTISDPLLTNVEITF
jgi:hypothetical protein